MEGVGSMVMQALATLLTCCSVVSSQSRLSSLQNDIVGSVRRERNDDLLCVQYDVKLWSLTDVSERSITGVTRPLMQRHSRSKPGELVLVARITNLQ